AQDYAVGSPIDGVVAGDFNGDGWLDAVTANGGNVSVLINDGSWPSFLVFGLSGFPSPTTAGDAHALTVTARDNSGNLLTSYAGTVHFSSSDSQAVLPADYTFTAADGGTHTFSVTLITAGTQSLAITDTTTAAF